MSEHRVLCGGPWADYEQHIASLKESPKGQDSRDRKIQVDVPPLRERRKCNLKNPLLCGRAFFIDDRVRKKRYITCGSTMEKLCPYPCDEWK
jgi:hypothetical protein